jgi:hypothetical protein
LKLIKATEIQINKIEKVGKPIFLAEYTTYTKKKKKIKKDRNTEFSIFLITLKELKAAPSTD